MNNLSGIIYGYFQCISRPNAAEAAETSLTAAGAERSLRACASLSAGSNTVSSLSAPSSVLKSAVQGHRRLFRKRLKTVTADRGFYLRGNEEWLQKHGITQVSIPEKERLPNIKMTISSNRGSNDCSGFGRVLKQR